VIHREPTIRKDKIFYVQDKLNKKSMIAMVDSGVNHNLLMEDMVRRLGLQPEPMQTTFKVFFGCGHFSGAPQVVMKTVVTENLGVKNLFMSVLVR
jgi:predicted aspartyl protease